MNSLILHPLLDWYARLQFCVLPMTRLSYGCGVTALIVVGLCYKGGLPVCKIAALRLIWLFGMWCKNEYRIVCCLSRDTFVIVV